MTMTKDLPYFKWFPGKYITGDITLCSMEAQGVFANCCNYYWTKHCSMSLANAKQRYSNNEAALNELLSKDIIKQDEEENIIIEFLDEQMQEFINVSEKRAISGAKGGRAKAKQVLSKVVAKSSNKEKEKEKEKEKDIYRKFSHLKISIDDNKKLLDYGYKQSEIDSIYESIENYKKNIQYKSLFLTAKKWLKKEYGDRSNGSGQFNNVNSSVVLKKPKEFEGYD